MRERCWQCTGNLKDLERRYCFMAAENQESPIQEKPSFELTRWYYILVSVLIILSLIRVSSSGAGGWEIALGIHEMTPLLVALAVLPPLLRFLVGGIRKGTAKGPAGLEFSWDNTREIDKEITDKQRKQENIGEAAKDRGKSQDEIEEIRRGADIDLEKTVAPQDLPFVRQVYLQRLHELVKRFNRNRHLRPSGGSTVAEADEIAYRMRSMAPLLFGQLDIPTWLSRPNLGKQLAAVKYLDWAQDIEFAEALATRLTDLEERGDTFQAYHVLLALYSMAGLLSYDYKAKVRGLIENYTPEGGGDSERAYVKGRILDILS
jgi:hypothetical protein